MFLIAMISLTMSRISSRAEFGVELGELGEVDRLDQRAEDRALGLVIALRVARVGRRRRERRRRLVGAAPALAGAGAVRAARRGRPREAARGRPRSRWRRGRGGAAAPASARPPRRRAARPRGCVVTVSRCYACRTRTDLRAVGHACRFSSLSSSGVSRPRCGLLRLGAAGEQLRELAERLGGAVAGRQLRRSSGRCWRRCRTAAARTE